MMPFINADPLRLATMHTPSTAIMKNSGEPKVSTSGLRIGMDRVSTRAPKMPPMADTVNAAPKARPASPRLAMAWPSMMVAWEPTVPGTAKEHGWNGVGGGGHRQHADDEGEGGNRIHVKGEGEQERQARDAAHPRDHPEHETEKGPGQEHDEMRRYEDLKAGLRYGVKH